jgi:hypothetical protein
MMGDSNGCVQDADGDGEDADEEEEEEKGTKKPRLDH